MGTMIKLAFKLLMALLLVGILYINCGLYYQPDYAAAGQSNADVLAQLRSLNKAIRNGAAEDMQQLFPEGYVFLHGLYGLAWCDVAIRADKKSELYAEAHAEIQFAYDHIVSAHAQSIFSEYQVLPYGAFYNGWCNYLLGKKLAVENDVAQNPREVAQYEARCAAIAQALKRQDSPYLSSYTGGTWPADMVVCMASLAVHDKLLTPRYQDEISRWLAQIGTMLDGHGLIPHAVHPQTGAVVEGARGSSQSLMLCFLPEIDADFSRQQFSIYRKLFLDYRLGLPGIREYPAGDFGTGDIDSGPVVFKIGSAASIVGIRAFRQNGDASVSMALRNSLEPLALPMHNNETKKYLFGQMPMADAFLTWAQASGRAEDRLTDQAWRIKFHVYTAGLVALVIFGYIYYKSIKRKRQMMIASKHTNE